MAKTKSKDKKKMKDKESKKIRIRFCPKCNSTNIVMVAGGQIGIWKCVNCGFQSSVFPEKEFEIKSDKNLKNKKSKK